MHTLVKGCMERKGPGLETDHENFLSRTDGFFVDILDGEVSEEDRVQHMEVRKALYRLGSRAKRGRCRILLDERWDRMLPPLPLHPAQALHSNTAEKSSVEETPVPPAAPAKVNCRRWTRATRRTMPADRTARTLTYSRDSGTRLLWNALTRTGPQKPRGMR